MAFCLRVSTAAFHKYPMRYRDFLTEAARRYEAMFSAFAQDGKLPDWVTARIRSIEALMKRQDRIVWALRWERYIHRDRLPLSANRAGIEQKFLRDLALTDNDIDHEISFYDTEIRDHFAHWFSLGVAEINNLVFDRQTPGAIWDILATAEDKWKKSRAQIINHSKSYPESEGDDEGDDDDEYDEDEDYDEYASRAAAEHARAIEKKGAIHKVIDFHDGWAWWNLARAYCRTEGSAMGHCGNQPSARPGDMVLSLRRDLGNGNFRPSLTFILNSNNELVEMKGRGNEKPAPKYYKMIVALLLDPIVTGCVGGGYAEQNNFSVLDLPEDVRSKLLELKPDLLSLHDRMRMFKQNPDEETSQSLKAGIDKIMGDHGFNYKRIDFTGERPVIVLQEWQSRETFITKNRALDYLDPLDNFFSSLEENLDGYCDPEKAQDIFKITQHEYFNEVFDTLLPYLDDDFLLDGVSYQVMETGQVRLCIAVVNLLSPSRNDNMGEDDDPTPILDRIRSLDATQDRDHSWNSWKDVKDNFDELDEVAILIAEYCWDVESRVEVEAVRAIYEKFSKEDEYHYHSNHPDQLSLDL